MATKTAEGAGAETGAQHDETAATVAEDAQVRETAEAREATGTEAGVTGEATPAEETAAAGEAVAERRGSGVGQGAAAVVSAALGLVSLSGGWVGTIASARAQLVGQLKTSSAASVSQQVKAVYGDAWHATALWAGLFAVLALVTGAVVLIRPAFGAPGRPQAPWIKSVAWAGVALGVVGLLLAVLKYSDALLGLPSAG